MTQSTMVLTYKRAVAAVRADYAQALGTIIYPKEIDCYIDNNHAEFAPEGKVAVRVLETDINALLHINDEFIDPYWDVEIVDDPEGVIPTDARSFWVFGPSYEYRREDRKNA